VCEFCKKPTTEITYAADEKVYCNEHAIMATTYHSCKSCDELILDKTLLVDGDRYHQSCFTCNMCSNVMRQFLRYQGGYYCINCVDKVRPRTVVPVNLPPNGATITAVIPKESKAKVLSDYDNSLQSILDILSKLRAITDEKDLAPAAKLAKQLRGELSSFEFTAPPNMPVDELGRKKRIIDHVLVSCHAFIFSMRLNLNTTNSVQEVADYTKRIEVVSKWILECQM